MRFRKATPAGWTRGLVTIAAAGLALLTAAGTAQAQVPGQADARAAEADRYLTARMQVQAIPGLQVAVVEHGRVVLLKSYGLSSVELSVPVTDRSLFAVNSITKAYTGVAAMRLVQAGRLDLGAPASRYLEDLPPAWRDVTVRQLLSHTSGLPEVTRAPTVETDDDAALAWVKTQPVRFAPGARFDYCQTNYMLMQMIVNRLEGRAPDAMLTDEQLAIAGAVDTRFGDSADLILGKGPSYSYRGEAGTRVLYPRTERFSPLRRAASGLNSTASDVARWIIALQDGRLLDPATRETMWTPIAFNDGQVGQWGMGWQVLRRGSGRSVGMTGGGRAAVSIYPEQDVAVVILTNLSGAYPEDMIDKVASIYAPGLELTGVAALRLALDDQGYDQAEAVADRISAADPGLVWPEAELNDWGYRLLASDRAADALPVFRLVVRLFPQSANAHDSLGEAQAANGDRPGAIRSYRRVLELDPGNTHAARQLEQLEGAAR